MAGSRLVLCGGLVFALGSCARATVVDAPVAVQGAIEPVPEISVMPQAQSGDSDPASLVRRQLERVALRLVETGRARRTDVTIYGALDHDSTATHSFAAADTGARFFVYACDMDCVDMELRVFDDAGRVLSDTVMIQEEVVDFRTQRRGGYRVRVHMTGCRANPCYYGLQLMAR